MRRVGYLLSAVAVLVGSGGCGGGSDSNGPNGSSGFSARVDGQLWQAEPIGAAAQAVTGVPGAFVIVGSETQGSTVRGLTISVYNYIGPGTYALGVGPSVYGGIASVGEGTVGSGNSNVWLTPLNGVAGTITISQLDNGRIKGTFEYTTEADNNNSVGGTRTVTAGSIDLPFNGTLAPVADNQGSRISATLNGKRYNAWMVSSQLTVFTGGAGVQISSTSSENALSLTLVGVVAPGTYPISITSPERFILVGLNGGTAENCCWGLNAPGDVGTITITSLTPTRVKGSFSGVLVPQPGKPAVSSLTVAEGSFDVGVD
jgi:hypothetical protein